MVSKIEPRESPEFPDKSGGRSRLPKSVGKDGVKWLLGIAKTFLDSLCVWPEHQNTVTATISVLCVLSHMFFWVGHFFSVTDKDADLKSIVGVLPLFTLSFMSVTKRLLLYFHRNRLSKLLAMVYFEFLPSDFVDQQLHKDILRRSYYLLAFCVTYSSVGVLCVIMWIALPLSQRGTPLQTEYPFSWKQSPTYELVYVWQSFLSIEVVFSLCSTDFFVLSLLLNCVVRFKLLRRFLVTKFERIVRRAKGDDPRFAKEAKELMLDCIKCHNMLLGFCKDLDNVFTYLVLVQYLDSITGVCLAGFIATAMPDDVVQGIVYFIGHSFQILTYCFVGNEITCESVKLSDATFQCGWHLITFDKDMQRSLVMVMARAQIPVRISIGGFGFLNLQTFLKLLQVSFSVYTVLNSLMEKQQVVV